MPVTKMRFKPMLCITLANILSFFLLFFYYDMEKTDVLYAGLILSVVNIIIYIVLYYFEFGDLYLFLTVSMLASIGLIMLYRLDPETGDRQLLWFLIGVVFYFIAMIAFGRIKVWDRMVVFYMVMCFVLFAVTAVFGSVRNGSKNWIFIRNISIQPSELIKICYCLAISCFFSKLPETKDKSEDERKRFLGIPVDEIILCAFVYACMGTLAVVQREWGTALLLFMIYFTMCFVYRSSLRLKLINIFGIIFVVFVGYFFLADHIGVRFAVWSDPWADPNGSGYQIVQSLIAIASGGYFGSGLGLGTPEYIPFSESDFIFAAICEEMGIFIGIAVILLYFLLSYRGLKSAIKCESAFLKAVSMSLVICFGYQTFIIVGGVIKLIPLTGITLPFVSYGGSSMISCFIMLGLLNSVSLAPKKKKKKRKRRAKTSN